MLKEKALRTSLSMPCIAEKIAINEEYEICLQNMGFYIEYKLFIIPNVNEVY
jgi:hypothetical protein